MLPLGDQYLDPMFILRKKKSLKRQIMERNDDFIEKRIAILGGSTTAELRDLWELFLLDNGIKPLFYESAYNRYYEESLFSAELTNFNPQLIYLHTNYRNLVNKPSITQTALENAENLTNEFARFIRIWQALNERFNCPIIQNNFDYPKYNSLGNLARTHSSGWLKFIDELNRKFHDFSQNHHFLLLHDLNYLAATYGLISWNDDSLWYTTKSMCSLEAMTWLAHSLTKIVNAIYGKSKKCLVLDLDNTLWGGVIGDDGVDKLQLNDETPIGEAYVALQKYIKELHARGVLLAIVSKNELDIAQMALKHPTMILQKDDFSALKINWNEKSRNILELAHELNLGIDSFVFFDDNPVERENIKQNLPQVAVPNIGEEVVDYIAHLDRNGFFETIALSEEDKQRQREYLANRERAVSANSFVDYQEFLRSLMMHAEISPFSTVYLERITQLINKTNQFNLTTKRYSSAEVAEIMEAGNRLGIYSRLRDKFGDSGLVSVIIGTRYERELHLNLWVMSCRVLQRELENAMLDYLVAYCRSHNIEAIFGVYYRTAKNALVEKHYEKLGFQCLQETPTESKWKLLVENYHPLNRNIKIEKCL